MTPREVLSAAAPPLRAAIAAVAAYAVSGALGLPAGHWAALSALIVSRPLPGAATRAGADRMAGTLLGAALARLREALARLSLSAGFALRLMGEPASEAATAHARALARRDGAALARLLDGGDAR